VAGLLAATTLADPATYPAAVDPPIANGAGSTRNALPGYDLPNRRVTGHRLTESPIRTSAMRSLGAYFNVFAIESAMDEGGGARGGRPRPGGFPARAPVRRARPPGAAAGRGGGRLGALGARGHRS